MGLYFEPHNYCKVVGSSALHPEFNSITEEIVRDAHEDFQQVNVYTVNEKKIWKNDRFKR